MKLKANLNNIKIILIVSIIFTLVGFAGTIQGIVRLELIEDLGISSTSILQLIFLFFSIGNSLSILFADKILKKIGNLKKILIFLNILNFLMIISFSFPINVPIFTLTVFLYGSGTGIYLFLANYMIFECFSQKKSTILINAMNFFYALASSLLPIYILLMKNIGFSWNKAFFIVSFINIVVLLITLFTDLDYNDSSENTNEEVYIKEKINLNHIFIMISLCFYVFAEFTLTFWLSEYFLDKGFLYDKSKISLTVYWIFIAIGRFVCIFIVIYMKPRVLLLILYLLSILGIIMLIYSKDYNTMIISVAFVGLGFSAIYGNLIAYGRKFIKYDISRIVGFYVFSGAFGGIIVSPITSVLKNKASIVTMLWLVISILILMYLFLIYINKREGSLIEKQ